jgi:hypothetical protein
MSRRTTFGVLFSCLVVSLVFAQNENTIALFGKVKDRKTSEAIPRASIVILGTSKGVIANTEGKYSINLEKGRSYRLRIRAIGFRDDTINVSIDQRTSRDISLDEQPVTGQEVVVRGDASRIEGRRIMREVIRRKKSWMDKLNDFTSRAYSRWNYKTISGDADSVVRSVIESVADIYWKKGKGLAERIIARKQTANLPPELNTFSLGQIQNFYDDRINFGEYDLVSPLAEDAFDVYDYDLLQKDVKLFGGTYSVIAVETGPLSTGFVGKLWVDESDYSVGYLELQPNDAVELGLINELRFEQRFDDIAGEYQLPIDLHMILGIKLQLPFVPRLHFEQLSVLKDYAVNVGVDDSLFEGRRHVALPQADSVSAQTWETERAIPLTDVEEDAYKRIDSSIALSRGDTVTSFGSSLLEALPSPDLPAYNQIEGLRLGISKKIQPISTFPFSLRGELKYGFKDEAFKYLLRAEQGLIWTLRRRVTVSGGLSGDISGSFEEVPEVTLSLAADLFDVYHERGVIYPSPFTSITSLIYKEDYQEFYRGRGYGIDLKYYPFSGSTAFIRFESQKISDVGTLHIVNDSATSPSRTYNGLSADLTTTMDIGGLDVKVDIDYLTTSKSFASEYEFSQVKLSIETGIRLGGLGKVDITGRYHSIVSGSLPRWNLFYFETRNKFFSSSSHFRALEPFEFMGDQLWMLYGEHNFYDLPMRLLGIKPSEYLNFHWFVFGGLGEADLTSSPVTDIHTTHDKPHGEIGVAIGNIFNIIRLEGTWRLTHKKTSNFYPTLSLGFTF